MNKETEALNKLATFISLMAESDKMHKDLMSCIKSLRAQLEAAKKAEQRAWDDREQIVQVKNEQLDELRAQLEGSYSREQVMYGIRQGLKPVAENVRWFKPECQFCDRGFGCANCNLSTLSGFHLKKRGV